MSDEKRKGFYCKCGAKMSVYRTCPKDGMIMRIRKCAECGRFKITYESTC